MRVWHLLQRVLHIHTSSSDACSISLYSPLLLSVAEGHLEVSQLLLAANADVNGRDKEYQPCLCMQFSNVPVMSCFIRLNTALHCSAQKGSVELSQLLLAANADVNARSQGYRPHPCSRSTIPQPISCSIRDQTPLFCSARHGHFEVLRLLLSSNADVDARDQRETTPLRWAACFGHLEACKILIEAKADAAAKDKCDAIPRATCARETVRISQQPPADSVTRPWHWPSGRTKPMSPHSCAASALLNERLCGTWPCDAGGRWCV